MKFKLKELLYDAFMLNDTSIMKNCLLLLMIVLTGCAFNQNPIPDGYTGDLAMISDSFSNQKKSSAHFFIVKKINGLTIAESGTSTRVQNSGRGSNMNPIIEFRQFPVQPTKLSIAGYIHYATDGMALFNDDLLIEAEFEFLPTANFYYEVKGLLAKDGSKLWIEDQDGKKVDGTMNYLD